MLQVSTFLYVALSAGTVVAHVTWIVTRFLLQGCLVPHLLGTASQTVDPKEKQWIPGLALLGLQPLAIPLCCNRSVRIDGQFVTINDRRCHYTGRDGFTEWTCMPCGKSYSFHTSCLRRVMNIEHPICLEHGVVGKVEYVCVAMGPTAGAPDFVTSTAISGHLVQRMQCIQ